ncbi:MAG: FG-GAP-like repeat-containing protein [Pirellulaceae bacterium]
MFNGVAPNLDNVSTLDGASIIVTGGVTVSLPAATSYTQTRPVNSDATLKAEGAGSVLDLSQVTSVTGSREYRTDLFIEASGGGQVDLSGVTEIPDGAVSLLSEGTNSVIDVSSLSSWVGYTNRSTSALEARGGGTIELHGASATRLETVTVVATETGTYSGHTIELSSNSQLIGTGTLEIDVVNHATVRPGNSPGTLIIDGDFVQGSEGQLKIELAGLDPGSDHSQFQVTGSASLSGFLDVSVTEDYVPSAGDAFVPLTFASRSGEFVITGNHDLGFSQVFDNTSLTLVVEGRVLTAGEPLSGNLTFNGNYDLFRFDAAGGEHLMFRLNGDSRTDDNELYVRHGAFPTPDDYDFAGVIADEPGQVVDVPSAQSGTYYVMAYGREDNYGADTYELRLDTDATLPTLQLGDSVSSHLANQGDFDLYRFEAIEDQRLFFTASGDSAKANRFIYLRHDASPTREEYDVAATEVDAPAQKLDLPASESGNYYVMIYAADGDAVGDYELLVDDIAFDRHVIASSFDGAATISATDLDGDGDMDVLATARDGDTIAWWEYDTRLGYQQHVIDSSFDGVTGAGAGDMDGDGDPDVVGTAGGLDEVAWWENTPEGFGNKTVVATSFDNASSVLVIDLDQDGDNDIVAAAENANEVAWWENDGAGGFTKHLVDDSFARPRAVAAGYLDGDGDMDIVGSSRHGDEIVWWENDGSGAFQKHVVDDEVNGPEGLHLVDLDGDGYLDLLVTAWESEQLLWYRNNGTGTFSKNILAEGLTGAQGVCSGDIDADGDLDIIAAADNADELSWWENRGNGEFVKYVLDASFDGASGVAASDLDGDGDIDILATGDTADEIVWWENLSVDRLLVVEVTPEVGGATGSVPTEVTVRFGADADPASIDAETFRVISSGADERFGTVDDVALTADTLTYDPADRLARFEYSAGFTEGRYRVALSDSMRSLSGGLLDGEGDYVSQDPDLLPSGNGVPGGDFLSEFTVDLTPPTKPENLRSYSHAVGVTSSDDTIEVTWSAADDAMSGIEAYRIVWDNQPDPNPLGGELVDGAAVTAVSDVLGDGDSHYVHVFSIDRAGNISPPARLGPFSIENGGPTVREVFPADGDFQYERPSQIHIVFNDDDVNASTITPGSFVVEASGGDGTFDDGNEVQVVDDDGVISFDATTRTAVFVPASPLTEDVHRITLLDSVGDVLGNALDGDSDGLDGGEFVSYFHYFTPVEVSGTITEDTTWRGLLVASGDVTVASGTTLTVDPGTIVKFGDSRLNVQGTLDVRGTHSQPVVITSLSDDTVGGDTNSDGDATSPKAGSWQGIDVTHSNALARLTHANIRYADRAVEHTAGNSELVGSTFRDGNIGIYVYSRFVDIDAENLVVADNRLSGIFLRAESRLDLRDSTVVGNGFAGSSGWFSAGIHLGGAALNVENSIIAFNANGLHHQGDPPLTTIANSDFYNPAGEELQWWYHVEKPDLTRNGNIMVDPLFVDRAAGNYELAPGSPAIDAGRGVDVPLTDLLGRPRYDDAGMANVGSGPVPYVDMGAFERQADSTPTDLAVTSVSSPLPASASPGESVSVEWTVGNMARRTAEGPWVDEVYLSTNSVFDSSDILLGSVEHEDDLVFGNSYTASLVATVPDTAGPQYILVRADAGRAIREADESNNLGVSRTPLNVAVPLLALDGTLTDTVSKGKWRYFRFDAEAGNGVRFLVDADTSVDTLGIFVRQGSVPTVQEHDVSSLTYGNPDPDVLLLDPVDGIYYIGVYGQWTSDGATDFTLSAESTALALHDVAQSEIGDTGRATLELIGENFAADHSIYVVAPDGVTTIESIDTALGDRAHVYATFDFSGAQLGGYDVVVDAGDGGRASLEDAITVVADGDGQWFSSMDVPSITRPGRKATITFNYGNSGVSDIRSPIITLESDEDVEWRVPGTDIWLAGTMQILALSPSGPASILRAGQTESLEIKIRTPFRQANMDYQSYVLGAAADDGSRGLIDWEAIQEENRPESITPEAWEPVWANVETQTGTTWSDYIDMLGDNAAYLAALHEPVYDVNRLFSFELLQAMGLSPYRQLASATDAHVSAPGMSLVFTRFYRQTIPARHTIGPFGHGWSHSYDLYLRETSEGDMLMHGTQGNFRLFARQDDGTYEAGPGDGGVLTANGDGTFTLREQTGTVFRFRDDLKFHSVTDPNGNSITAAYDDENLTQLTHSSGQSLDLQYNDNGRIEQISDHMGRTTVYQYDASGEHLIQVTAPGNQITAYEYSPISGVPTDHALLSITLPAGERQFFEYDEQGRLTGEYVGDDAEMLTYSYDAAGTVAVTDAASAVTQLYFDWRGLLTRSEDPLGHVSQRKFDSEYNLTQMVRPDGLSYQYSYDALGNVTQITDPLGHATTFQYDPRFSHLQWFRDARGNTTHYDYDPNGNLVSTTDAAGNAEVFEVDPLGNVVRRTNRRGQPVEYTYNDDGLLTKSEYADGSLVEYTYDARGNMKTAVDENGSISFSYNEADQLTRVEYPSGRSLDYEYNANGQRTRVADQDGFTVNYSYDEVGRLERLSDAADTTIISYSYDPVGRLVREDKGNGTYTTYEYDDAGQLLKLVNHAPDGAVQSRFDYSYDSLGRRIAMSTTYGEWTYAYDATGQLTQAVLDSTDADISDKTISYEYDPVGNRISVIEDGITTDYETNELNQYTSVGDMTFQYDADGNLILRTEGASQTEFVFDDDNRLTEVLTEAHTWAYGYDPLGHRNTTEHDGATVEYLVDPTGMGHVIGEYDGSGVLASYAHGLGLVRQLDQLDQRVHRIGGILMRASPRLAELPA